MKTYKDFVDPKNIEELREGIMAILYEETITVTELAKKMDILPATLSKFIKQEGDVSLLTLMKIDEYIKGWKSQ